MSECRRFIIEGRVQGVFFRESTRREAERLNLTGSAVNLDDGSVEVIACGAESDLESLEAWLWKGPPAADVTGVISEETGGPPPVGFRTG